MSIGNEKTMRAAAGVGAKSGLVSLNVRQRCDEASEFELELFQRIVAQDEAALALSQIYQVYFDQLHRGSWWSKAAWKKKQIDITKKPRSNPAR